ncbi:MAG: SDR family oxidoreductase [Pirellulales bacterium]
MPPDVSTLIFGCGYLGSRVARRLLDRGEIVFAATRSSDRARQLQRLGCRTVVADVTEPSSLTGLPQVDRVLYAIGYDRRSDRSIQEVYAGGLQAVLDAVPPGFEKLLYISSTGVYSQTGDAWIDEQSPCEPVREGGKAALAAERVLQDHASGLRGVILRLAGIYGPGRVPYLDKMRQGEPIPSPQRGFLNLIHVEDAASIVLAALDRATPPALFCVSDGQPVKRGDYYREAAKRIGAPQPRFATDPQTPAASRASSSKRVSNRRLVEQLGVTLAFSSYREGLAAILSAESSR